ncbi:PREDICTED: stress enhanced protein 1, chloroplastic-like isoform X2 [Camelina sativa]|uniref:Stress enhanced protein 1, chloroplastic-like isoform X2 n=1 Tax=Camelina sativa TaxID=90675 RepID=A0ABM1QJ25_CAMSA|nr:PREDICTED: stress enhanced protein 1, chloroplastic-like isoform X2 [Camelina sativa]
MALSQVSASLAFPNSGAIKLATIANRSSSTCRVHVPQLAGSRSSFASGSPLLPLKLSVIRRGGNRAATVSVRSEQSTEGSSGLDIWLGRGAMIGFAVALTVEITTEFWSSKSIAYGCFGCYCIGWCSNCGFYLPVFF